MKLVPIQTYREKDFDDDSLVYEADYHLFYGTAVKKELLDDIFNNTISIFGSYYTYSKENDSPRIYYLGRGKESGKVKIKIQNFQPHAYEYDENGDSVDYLGKRCEKLIFKGQHPSKVSRYREYKTTRGFSQPLEADIIYTRKFLIDTYDYFKPTEPIPPKIAVLDIETDYPVSDKIISFALNGYDDYLYFESKYDGSTEKELIKSLFEQVKRYDIITGWNITFDAKEINKKSNVKLHQVVSVVDLHTDATKSICKKMYGREVRGGWKLDNVGNRLCGIAKSLDEDDMKGDVRDLNEEKLRYYNCIDTIIPEIIDNHLGGIDTHLILAWSLHSCVDDMIITAVVNDIALLRAYHKAGKVLPSRNYEKEPKSKPGEYKYKAAEPSARPGVYDDIVGLDIVHAYGSAVIGKNISPETKDPNGKNVTPSTPLYPDGVRYNDNNSIFIKTLKDLMVDRAKIKKQLKSMDKEHSDYNKFKSMDFSYKTEIAALSHGMFGWAQSRVRDYSIADSITAVVRETVNKIKSTCDLIGNKWIYSHTDSAFILAKKEDAEKITKHINDVVRNYCEGYKIIPELEFEAYFPVGYIHTAARRVLVPECVEIDDDENWVVKGMSFMRSETPEPLGDIEVELIKMKLKKEPIEKLLVRLKEMIKELPNYDSIELALIKPLNKPVNKFGRLGKEGTDNEGKIVGIPFHVKSMQLAEEEYGLELVIGSKYGIISVITDEMTGIRVKRMKNKVIAFSLNDGLPSNYKINYEAYLDSNLFGKVFGLFEMKTKELKMKVLEDKELCEKLGIEYKEEIKCVKKKKLDSSTYLEELEDSDTDLKKQVKDTNVSGIVTTTNMQSKPTTRISEKNISQQTSQKSQHLQFQNVICSVEDFLVNHSQLLENEEDLMIPEAQCFLKLQELLKLKNLKLYSLKTSKVYSITPKGKLSKSSFKRWMNWGMECNGWYLTANFMEYPRTGKECSLSDILEEQVEEKYYLSEKMQVRFKEYLKEKSNTK